MATHIDETTFRKALGTEAESVAEYRARHNISDIWVEWSHLTEYEKNVEVYHTPRVWASTEEFQSPPDFACTPVTNTRGESLSFFYPTDHESNQAYVFEIDGDVIGDPVHSDYSPKNTKGGIQLFEDTTIGKFFALTQLPQPTIYALTRLLIPHHNVVLF